MRLGKLLQTERPGDSRGRATGYGGQEGVLGEQWAGAHPRALLLCRHLWLPEVLRWVQGPETWEIRETVQVGSWGWLWSLRESGHGPTSRPCLLASPELQGVGSCRAGPAGGREVLEYAEGAL